MTRKSSTKRPKPVVVATETAPAGDNLLIAWGDELAELDDQIESLQVAKRDFYTAVRDNHGKVTASALKAAQRLRRMDSEKREQAEAIDDETARILAILERPRAPRATRTREGKPVLTVVGTGEIQESAAVLNRRGSTSTENVSDEISQSEGRPDARSTTPAGSVADAIPSTVSMQEPRVEAEGQGGAVHEHGREEGSQTRLPSDWVENKPGATAVIAVAPIPPVGAADDHSVIAGAGAAVASAAPAEIPDADIPAFLKVGHRHPAMQTPASPRAEAIALRRPFCQHLNNWAKCAGHGDVHCSSCQKIADEARQ